MSAVTIAIAHQGDPLVERENTLASFASVRVSLSVTTPHRAEIPAASR